MVQSVSLSKQVWAIETMFVYAQPELEGEVLDGKRLFEDITYSDSYGREFYALEDGSYFLIENKTTTLLERHTSSKMDL